MSASHSTATEERLIVQAAGQIGFYTLLSRITGLVRDMAIGTVFGAGAVTDTFFTAFRIPNMLRRMVGEGAATAALVPIITEYRERHSAEATIELIRSVVGVGICILLVLTVAGMVWADPIASALVPGFSPAKLALTITQLRLMFPYLFFIGLSAIAMGILHAFRHFAAPAFAPILLNLVLIVTSLSVGWLAVTKADSLVFYLAGAVVVGGMGQLLWQFPALQRIGVVRMPLWHPSHPALRQIMVLLVPVFGSGLLYQLSLLINNVLASFLRDGSVSSLWYATRIFEFPQGVFVLALSSAVLPSLTVQAQRGDLRVVGESLVFALRLANFLVVPATVGLIVLAVPICAVLFFHGAFGESAVRDTAVVLRWMVLGLWSVAVARLLTACLYALQDTRSPLWASIVAFLASVVFGVMFMGHITVAADAGRIAHFLAKVSTFLAIGNLAAGGLALATSLAATVNAFMLGVFVVRRLEGFPWTAWLVSFAWSMCGAVVMAGPVWWIQQQIDWFDRGVPYLARVGVLMLAILVGVSSFIFVTWWGGKVEFAALLKMLPNRLLRRLPQFLQASH